MLMKHKRFVSNYMPSASDTQETAAGFGGGAGLRRLQSLPLGSSLTIWGYKGSDTKYSRYLSLDGDKGCVRGRLAL